MKWPELNEMNLRVRLWFDAMAEHYARQRTMPNQTDQAIPAGTPAPTPAPAPATVDLKMYLTATTRALLETAPQNPTLRGLILAETNLWFPDTLTQPGQIKEWLQAEIAKRPAPPAPEPKQQTYAEMMGGTPPIRFTRPPAPNTVCNVEMVKEETEHGRARYRARNRGTGLFTINRAFVRELLETQPDSWDDLRGTLERRLNEWALETITAELQNVDDEQITDRDTEEVTDTETYLAGDIDPVMRAVRNCVAEIDPDEYERIENEE